MGFNSLIFFVFTASVLIIYWIIPKNSLRLYFLTFAGLIYVLYYQPINLLIYLIFITFIYLLGQIISYFKNKSLKKNFLAKFILAIGVIFCLFFLSFYKYRPFFLNILKFSSKNVENGEFFAYLIPVGISFLIFEAIHYLVEVYQNKIKDPKLKDFFLFLFFFPTMIAGHIKRYGNFKDQFSSLKAPKSGIIFNSIKRIILGLGKKILIVNFLIQLTDLVFPNFNQFSPEILLLSTYLYSIIIFFDFSGYSDVAIGISNLFGFNIPENFNSPYLKENISSFWESWHISLTKWIKDYIFIPLGGSRKGFFRYLLNVMVVFTLIGFWHGSSWNFVFWGIYHGIGLCLYQIYKRISRKISLLNQKNSISQILGIFLTFNFVSFGWVLFKMNLSDTFLFWKNIFISKVGYSFIGINLAALVFFLIKPKLVIIQKFENNISSVKYKLISVLSQRILLMEIKYWLWLPILSLVFYFVLIFLNENVTPYVYEQF